MVKTYYQNQLPHKLILYDPHGRKYTFYRSTTEYLSYNDRYFTEYPPEEKRKENQMQILQVT